MTRHRFRGPEPTLAPHFIRRKPVNREKQQMRTFTLLVLGCTNAKEIVLCHRDKEIQNMRIVGFVRYVANDTGLNSQEEGLVGFLPSAVG